MKDKIYLGVLFTLLSTLCYSIQVLMIKVDLPHMPVPVLVFIQSLICLIFVTPVLLAKYKKQAFNPISFSNIKMQHLLRTIFSLGISFFLFTAVQKISYVDSVMLFNTFPLFIPLIGFFILKAQINHRLWPFIFIGFAGVIFVLPWDHHVFSSGALYAIGSGLSAGISIVLMRKISSVDDSVKSLYYYFLFSTIISGVVSIPFWHNVANWHLLSVIVVGVLFFFVQYFLTLAASCTTPQVVSTLYYSNVLFSLLLSYWIFSQVMSLSMLVGMLCIIAGGLGVIYFSKKPREVTASIIADRVTTQS